MRPFSRIRKHNGHWPARCGQPPDHGHRKGARALVACGSRGFNTERWPLGPDVSNLNKEVRLERARQALWFASRGEVKHRPYPECRRVVVLVAGPASALVSLEQLTGKGCRPLQGLMITINCKYKMIICMKYGRSLLLFLINEQQQHEEIWGEHWEANNRDDDDDWGRCVLFRISACLEGIKSDDITQKSVQQRSAD